MPLHAEDAAIVREHRAAAENERAWARVEDPMKMHGGCQVLPASSWIEVRLKKRLGALRSELLGSERDPEHGTGDRG